MVRFLPSAQTMHTSTIVGTLVYMAPEYAKGVVSPAADVYGLGVVSYHCSGTTRLTPLPPGAVRTVAGTFSAGGRGGDGPGEWRVNPIHTIGNSLKQQKPVKA